MKRVYTMAVAVSLSLAALLLVWSMLTTLPAQAAPPTRPLLLPGDCVVTSTLDSGAGSLRQCMLGLQTGATITFSTAVFPPGSPATIALTDELPSIITNNVTIDATNAGVILNGAGTLSGTNGLAIEGVSYVTIKGLRILNFPNDGIHVFGGASYNTIGGTNATPGGDCTGDCNLISGNGSFGVWIGDADTVSNTISGNYIGTNISGTAILGNNWGGVGIFNNAQWNTIGGNTAGRRNLISGNYHFGITMQSSDTISNSVIGNYIGTDATGTYGLGNSWTGVFIAAGASHNIIGGKTPGERNIISGNGSGNGSDGVAILDSDTFNNTVSGNYIGTNASGTAALGNAGSGVRIGQGASFNLIGGGSAGERNLISGNGGDGVRIASGGTMSNTVSGNYIGTNINGMAAISNTNQGVYIGNGASYNLVGGSNSTPGGACSGACNLISGNGDSWWQVGVWIDGSGTMSNTISGNYIGTTVNGTTKLGNASEGIRLNDGPRYNIIGGTTATERNIISGNHRDGVDIGGAHNNLIVGNYVGTDVSGLAALGNTERGIGVNEAGMGLATTQNTIKGNLISGNGTNGIDLYGADTVSNVVSGNYIGTDTTGNSKLGNGGSGIWIGGGANNNLIGGSTPGERNLISGNGDGISIVGATTMSNTVSGNYIGTDVSGTVGLGNDSLGIGLSGGAYNVIGGVNTTPGGNCSGECNLLSANGEWGIIISDNAFGNTVSGNYIGTDVSGTLDLGNEDGIKIDKGASYNLIGGNSPGRRNLISHSQDIGMHVDGNNSLYNTIQQNLIYSNTQGIELSNGGNLELFPPILTNVTTHTVEGQAPPNSTVEIFSDAEDEGRYFHGSVATDASGNFNFSQTNAFTGANVTATATDGDGNTSEFSAAYTPLIDARLIAILQPKEYGKTGQTVTPTVKIGNAGTTAEVVDVAVAAVGDGGLNYTASQTNISLPLLGYATLTFAPFTPGVVGAYHFTATVTLSDDQAPGNNVQVITASIASDVIDLWTRDNPTDTGDIPTSNFWQSPDLWVRNADDNGLEHQDPFSGTTNYVYMIVRNRGTAQAGMGNTAKIYWHEPSLGIKCGDWAQIDTAKPISTTLLNPTTQLLKFSWTPTRTGHTCLHGEINSTADPIMNPCDIPWDNNLSQRNVDIIPGGVGGQGIEAQAAGGIVFEVTNIKDKPKPVDLIVDVSQVAGSKTVRLDLGNNLAGRWAGVNGLAKSSGIAWTGGTIITITNPTSGTIAGIPLSGGETQTVTLLVNAPAVVTAAVTVYEAIDAGPGVASADAIVGGNTYVFNSEIRSVYLPIILKNR